MSPPCRVHLATRDRSPGGVTSSPAEPDIKLFLAEKQGYLSFSAIPLARTLRSSGQHVLRLNS
jgi:hypothetical protein